MGPHDSVLSREVVAASGTPDLRASYSEFLGYVGVDGDGDGTQSANPHRHDVYTVTQPRILTSPPCQPVCVSK